MAVAVRASDLRRSKWGSFRGSNNANEDLISLLQREMDERPKPLYALDEEVKTPIGVRTITDKYYRPSEGWIYTFYSRYGLYKFKEKELLPGSEKRFIQDVMNLIAARG